MPEADPVLQLYQDLASIHGGLRAPDAAIVERAMRFIHDSPAPRLSGSLPPSTPNIAERVGILEDALREGIKALESQIKPIAHRVLSGPEKLGDSLPMPGRDPVAFIDYAGGKWQLVQQHELAELAAKLQEGIDGGQRAKAELDAALDGIAGQSAIRMQGHENRLEKLEDKAGSIGEWQEAVDAQLNEAFGRLLELEAGPLDTSDVPPPIPPRDLEVVPIKPIRLRLRGADGKLITEYAISPWSEKFSARLPFEAGEIHSVEVYRG